ncbi:MAG: hypothetical protein GFH27_549293n319 [Chloroflexi bacterium AL-W]|nr:hypothetical protein [Chloroflexi bacterium AL-N1]NOK67566.1 hypothetical protein [Chloroflexi bacterium AL-N10]NOK75664.1 hypothetical protein [Chloroflexi bacterium AL-N5]NOK82452.1 hypothetical protein [Chloroflexi bacterium AL-W]NOK90297.1 hypothetical protein [Chloroflexi bacterium AL-N15]
MKNDNLQSIVNKIYFNEAEQYESQHGHGISDIESLTWQSDILSLAQFNGVQEILDVGAGTGLLTRLLAHFGYSVTGLDPSDDMLKQAIKNTSIEKYGESIKFVLGDTHQSDIFQASSFDCVVSRQVVCHFYDPMVVFGNWYTWLKDNGVVVITDGLWFREGWSNDELVDSLPLSCLQTRATVSYLLEKSGFRIIKNTLLNKVNEHLIATGKSKSLRYVVVALKDKVG